MRFGSEVLLGQCGKATKASAYWKVSPHRSASSTLPHFDAPRLPIHALRADAMDSEDEEGLAWEGIEQGLPAAPGADKHEARAPEGSGCIARMMHAEYHIRHRVRRAIEDPTSGPKAQVLDLVVVGLIVLSTLCAVLVTVAEFEKAYHQTFQILETVFTGAFTLEIFVRLWTARTWEKYFCSPSNQVDILATLPWYVEAALTAFSPHGRSAHLQDVAGSMRALRIARLVRMLRVAKFARHSEVVHVVLESLLASRTGFAVLVAFLGMGSIVSATLVYAMESEQPNGAFKSIPAAMWWAMTTITTVGYGDMVPSTTAGKLVGCMTMVGGTLIVSLSVAMITSSFTEQYRQRSEIAKVKKAMKLEQLRCPTGESTSLDFTPEAKSHDEIGKSIAFLEDESRQVLAQLENALTRGSEGDESAFNGQVPLRSRHTGSTGDATARSFGQPVELLLLENLKAQNEAFLAAARGLADRCALQHAVATRHSTRFASRFCMSQGAEEPEKPGEPPSDAGDDERAGPGASPGAAPDVPKRSIGLQWPRRLSH